MRPACQAHRLTTPTPTPPAGTPAAACLTTVPKISALLATYRLVTVMPYSVDRALLVAVLGAVTLTLGDLAAFAQTDVRRLLGWSTVSRVGYLLPVTVAGTAEAALPSLLLYLGGYAVTDLTAFAVVAAVPRRRTLDDYVGLATASPWLGSALIVSLLSLVGAPPDRRLPRQTGRHHRRLGRGIAWLVVVAAVNTVASLFYYLRWLAPAFRRNKSTAEAPRPTSFATAAAVLGGVATLGFGILVLGVMPMLEMALAGP